MADDRASSPLPRSCSQCGSSELRRVDRVWTIPGRVGVTSFSLDTRWDGDSKGPFRAEICRTCGHAEFYLVDPADLDRV